MPTVARDRIVCAVLCLFLWAAAIARAAEPGANATAAEFDFPESTFLDDYRKGKDPFFPTSTRRVPKGPTPGPVVPAIPTVTDLVLRGISGTADRRVALINQRTFEVGETGEVRISGKDPMTLTCVEIRATSVVITLAGRPERHELRLEDQPLPLGGQGQ